MIKRIGAFVTVILCASSCAYLSPLNKGYLGDGAIRTKQLDLGELTMTHEKERFKSILNLRGERPGEEWYDNELAFAKSNGIEMVSVGLSPWRFPSKENLTAILEYFDRAKAPLLIHCKAGADRAGFVSVLYRHLKLGEPIRGLSINHGHVRFDMALDKVIRKYRRENGTNFIEWLENDYDPSKLNQN